MPAKTPVNEYKITRDNVNAVIMRRTIAHTIELQRLGNGEARKIAQLVADARGDILAQFVRRMDRIRERGFDLGPVTTRRMHEMEMAFGDIVKRLRVDAYNTLRDDLVELASYEAQFNVTVIDDAMPVKYEMVLPARETLRAAVLHAPFDGNPLRAWFNRLESGTKARLNAAVRMGVTQGESIDQIARRIRGTRAKRYRDGIMGNTRQQAEALARTGVNHISTQARRLLFEQNPKLVKRRQWVATLDTKTCLHCMSLDGRVFPVDSARGWPPAHVNCRCTVTPVTPSWRELGIDLDEAPEGTRASVDGQVPARMTYPQWLRQASRAQQNRALGPRRAERWRAGREKITEFTNDLGDTLTLPELDALEKQRAA